MTSLGLRIARSAASGIPPRMLACSALALIVILFVLVSSSAAAHSNNPYKIVPNHSANYMCLDAGNGSWGTVVVQQVCNGATSQQFDLIDVGGGWENVKPRNVSGVCLDIAGASQGAGAQLIVWGCNGGTNQQFSTPQCSTGCMGTFVAHHSGMCLDVQYGNVTAGTEVDQFWCVGHINQQFSIHNDPGTRQKTGFPERWYPGPCGSPCPTSWMTLSFHRNVPTGLQSAWNSAIDNAKGAWNSTPNTVFLSEDPVGITYPNQDVILNATQDGCWNIPELGRSSCVPSGVAGLTYWLKLDHGWACPSGTITCANDRVPDVWWWSIIGTREQSITDATSDVGIRALLRQATVAHEAGHALYLRHEYSPADPEVSDGICSASPTRPSIMDGDCIVRRVGGVLQVPTYVSPQAWDSCGINHAYYDPNWGYSGC